MSDLQEGNYLIVLAGPAAPPPFPVGANGEGATIPVISDGKNNIWTATKLSNGNYTLILQQTGPRWLSQAGEEEVFVSIMPLPGEWRIQKHKREDNDVYSIEMPSQYWPTKAWTLESTEPGTKVKLRTYELPTPDQLWSFTPPKE